MSFQNLYYKRTAGTAKACFVCYRPSTTVLATINTVDFLYTCPGHLSDPNFATVVKDNGNGERKQVTAEEIDKVKEEWKEKQRRKKEKEKEAAAAEKVKKDDEKDKEKEEEKEKETKKKDDSPSPSAPVKTPLSPATPAPRHERYILHRDFFAMRLAEHRRRRQTAQAKELGPRLPGVPGGSIG